ncbi:hypothetical protein [Sinorhizobium meliloti]|uniref:hypothetical protein n=1 Tax=Rhizobium meliloti TaxID=382 RepID=UPI00299D1199|nr:hypothetical protein [Sinorhizobium meliloti]MDW9991071.1 hypothetical protein [Sinorhizobium meliloti]MDX0245471.1 hypothetical protein [Sinorhizobium meliloti]MDX0401525.1 hypothetical protein [Sinorhizobium meliloti]
MLNQFNLYIIIGLFALFIATSGAFAIYHRITKAEIAVLEQQNATYKLAVQEQSRTIDQMTKDAERLAQSNKFLAERFATTESEFVSDVYRIDALDLDAIDGLEEKINAEFQRSLDQLRQATSR